MATNNPGQSNPKPTPGSGNPKPGGGQQPGQGGQR